MTNDIMTKKYILKPGTHQFAPRSAAIHNNDNLSDAEAKWYLKKYPHISSLFISVPTEKKTEKRKAGDKLSLKNNGIINTEILSEDKEAIT